MRTNKFVAGGILAISYPFFYYTWVKAIKNTWVISCLVRSIMILLTDILISWTPKPKDLRKETLRRNLRRLWYWTLR